MNSSDVKLQVLICTCGEEGIRRVAEGKHPEVGGVEYLVSWQASEGIAVPEILKRPDFRIARAESIGLSRNRNHALSQSTSPLMLISDDDADYTAERLQRVIREFDARPDEDILTFRFESGVRTKNYPAESFPLDSPPHGWYVSSLEIAFRNTVIDKRVHFNEHFGIGAEFPSGEEGLFLHDCLAAGLRGRYIPVTIAYHESLSTGSSNQKLATRPMTKGAVFLRTHPRSWFARMVVHALREVPAWIKGETPSPLSFCIHWLRGVKKARGLKVFED